MDHLSESTAQHSKVPSVLCIGGHDPSGGAGIIADAEAVQAAGAYPLTVITALTEQNTCALRRVHLRPPEQVVADCRHLLADSPPQAIKIGMTGNAELVEALVELLAEHPRLPLVLDPVLASTSGHSLADARLLVSLREQLIPHCTLLTPNLPEARTLGGAETLGECVAALGLHDAQYALVTGTHARSAEVIHRLFDRSGECRHWCWPRLAGEYHGSGCTLASAIAARLALGQNLFTALEQAQQYTWTSLRHAWRTGRCQLTPNRLHHPTGTTNTMTSENT